MSKKSAIKIGMIYACSVIGVGFASGNEVLNFFSAYGFNGFAGILVSSFVFSVFGYMIVDISFKTGLYNMSKCYRYICGPAFSSFANIVGICFYFSLFFLMLSAWSTVLDEYFKLPVLFEYSIFIILFFLYNIFDLQRKSISSFIRVIILAGTAMVLSYIVFMRLIDVFSTFGVIKYNLWYVSALMYVGYNSFVSSELICKACETADSKQSAQAGGIIGGCFLFILSFFFNLIFILWYNKNHNFPLLDMLEQGHSSVKLIFTIILSVCILYSGFNSGAIMVEKISVIMKTNKILTLVCISLVSLVAVPVGFTRLINFIYPFFGITGLIILILFLTTALIKNLKITKNSNEL